ncbi:ankyrin repeat and protein kinase domain-containing protein 1 [Halyomorpha halys]|uniref:ankyrin repeat and protein kinase domain-containing protein 1 n=1 Tax=Halyomorpha halys TaxID=286706 RepID=UPI0006D51D36|nr:ankyrin-2-like [Halyomorpha halys]
MDPSKDVEMSLHKAVIDGMTDVVEAILLRGTDPDTRDEETGRTAAHCAVQAAHLQMLQLLKEYRADLSIIDYMANTPLSEAVQRGKVEVVVWLLNNLSPKESVVEDMFFLATVYGQVNVMSTLMTHGANIESKNDLGRNALFLAAENGQSEAVSFLLNRGANPAVCDDFKKTLLHAAADSGDPKTIDLIQKRCPDKMDARDKSGDTPLHCAATTNTKAVVILLERGAPIDLRNEHGYTPLDSAIRAKKMEIADLLRNVYQFDSLTKRMENL